MVFITYLYSQTRNQVPTRIQIPDGYIALYRTCSHCTDSDLDPYLDLDPNQYCTHFLGQISIP